MDGTAPLCVVQVVQSVLRETKCDLQDPEVAASVEVQIMPPLIVSLLLSLLSLLLTCSSSSSGSVELNPGAHEFLGTIEERFSFLRLSFHDHMALFISSSTYRLFSSRRVLVLFWLSSRLPQNLFGEISHLREEMNRMFLLSLSTRSTSSTAGIREQIGQMHVLAGSRVCCVCAACFT
jgi:hypothetical protein